MKAPFPWFGGKSRVAHIVWPRFGNVPNYVEPFAGSLAVMLLRPHAPRIETVNDIDCYISNFWRAVQADPATVAAAADWPVNEADLHARHQWLYKQEEFRERMHTEKDFYDAEVAGLWVWGISAWIGDNWCRVTPQKARPNISPGKGIHTFQGDGTGLDRRRPNLSTGQGVHKTPQKRPNLSGYSDKGGHKPSLHRKCPDMKRGGKGVQSERVSGRGRLSQQIPDLGGDGGASGRGTHAKYTRPLYDYFQALSDRLRYVRVCCGQWHRILGPSPTIHIGVTAVFLDPPYGAANRDKVYNYDSKQISVDVRDWCIEHGDEKKLRIALCGYEGEHNELEDIGWDKTEWKASGGYGARNPDNKNADRERIWFSPHCLIAQRSLFEALKGA